MSAHSATKQSPTANSKPLPARWARMAADTGKPFADGGAYSSDCYADWTGIVWHLYQRGATCAGAADLLRSKHMRWCNDSFDGEYGTCTVEHFSAYLDKEPSARVTARIDEAEGGEHPAKAALDAAQSAGTRFASAMVGALDALPDDAAHAAARQVLAERINAVAKAMDLGAVFEALPAKRTTRKGAAK